MSWKQTLSQELAKNSFKEKTKTTEGIKEHFYQELRALESELKAYSGNEEVIVQEDLSPLTEKYVLFNERGFEKGLYVQWTDGGLSLSKIDPRFAQTTPTTTAPKDFAFIAPGIPDSLQPSDYGARVKWINQNGVITKWMPLEKDTLDQVFKIAFFD